MKNINLYVLFKAFSEHTSDCKCSLMLIQSDASWCHFCYCKLTTSCAAAKKMGNSSVATKFIFVIAELPCWSVNLCVQQQMGTLPQLSLGQLLPVMFHRIVGIEGKRRLFCSSSFLPHFDALFAILFVQHLFCCADIHLFFMLQYFVRNDVNYL